MSDSSPHGLGNLQISEVYTIQCEDVLPLGEAVDEIIGLRQQLAEEARRVDGNAQLRQV